MTEVVETQSVETGSEQPTQTKSQRRRQRRKAKKKQQAAEALANGGSAGQQVNDDVVKENAATNGNKLEATDESNPVGAGTKSNKRKKRRNRKKNAAFPDEKKEEESSAEKATPTPEPTNDSVPKPVKTAVAAPAGKPPLPKKTETKTEPSSVNESSPFVKVEKTSTKSAVEKSEIYNDEEASSNDKCECNACVIS